MLYFLVSGVQHDFLYDIGRISQFRYLGHIIDNSFLDDSDINREVKALFERTNLLCRRFKRCSYLVKVRLFPSFFVCVFMILPYGVTILLVLLAGLPRVIVSV